jgi:hypothetical protein
MADIPVTPITDYGALLSSQPQAMSNIALQQSEMQTQAAQRQAIPSQIAATQAGIAYTQAQTQGQQYLNAFQQAKLQQLKANADMLTQPAVNDQTATPGQPPTTAGVAPATSATTAPSDQLTLQDAGLDPASITQHAQQQFAVPASLTDPESTQLAIAAANKLYGLPDNTDSIKAAYAARVATATAHAQYAASQAYDSATAVLKAPDGAALSTLDKIGPDGAAHANAIAQLAAKNGWTPDQTDQFVRTYASEVANAVHKYSGRDITVGADGTARDSVTQQPVPGANPIGLSAAQHADALAKAQDPVAVKQQDGSVKNYPKWQVDGAPSAEAWINNSASNGGTYAPTPGNPVANSPRSQPHPVTGAPPGTAPAAGGHALPAPIASDPALSKALADPEYAQPGVQTSAPSPTAQSQNPGQEAQMEANAKAQADARNGLLTDAASDTKAAQTSLTYMQAAKAILDSKGAPVQGPLGGIIAWAGAASHLGAANAANYQELAKYLGNAALPGIAEKFGTSRTTGNEVALQMDKLSPSPSMNDQATRNLLDKNIAYSQYMIDSAKRVAPYLAYGGNGKGGDPQRFAEWNHDNYPAEKIVNQGAPAVTAPPAGGGKAPAITSKAQYDALPSGSTYTFNGRTGIKP